MQVRNDVRSPLLATAITGTDAPAEDAAEMIKELNTVLDNKELETILEEENYIDRLERLMIKLLEQQIRITEKERVQREEQKKVFSYTNEEWGAQTKAIGWRSFKSTVVSFVALAAITIARKDDREVLSFLAKDGIKSVTDMLNNDAQTKQKLLDGRGALSRDEIQAIMNKGSSESSSKQELLSLWQKVLETLKEAARAA